MLTANELAAMRTTVNGSLPDTATILRATTAADGAGGRTLTWVEVATVAARFAPADTQGSDPQLGGQAANMTARAVDLPSGTDVTVADRIAWGTHTFEVSAVRAPRSWELLVRVALVEVV